MNLRRRRLGPCAMFPLLSAPAVSAKPKLRFAMGRDENDRRFDFARDLLLMALDAAGQRAELQLVPGLSQLRIERELASGDLDVGMLPSFGQRPAGVLPVRIPIRRGLLGVRLLLARRENHAAIEAVQTLRALQRGFSMGYGSDWVDLELMRDLGFRIVTSATYTGLFQMLRAGRFDFLSRGLSEVWDEVDNPALVGKEVAVVPGIALFQPLDDYFHVGTASLEWAPVLQRGLTTLLRDHRYALLFQRYFAAALRRAGMASRRVLLVVGYGVGVGTPLDQFDVLELNPAEGRVPPRPREE